MTSKHFVTFATLIGFLSISSLGWAGGADPYTGQEDPNKKILKTGLLGAGTGALASGVSGGDAGKGALIGAGTNVIGGALLDMLTAPSKPAAAPVYYAQPPQQQYAQQQYAQQPTQYAQQQYPEGGASNNQPQKKIIRKYDAEGNITEEEEIWE